MNTRYPRRGYSSSQRLLTIALCLHVAGAAWAQFGGGTAINGATILVGDGTTIENGTVVISGEKIAAVNADGGGPSRGGAIDAAGKILTPGFIDAWSALGLRGAAESGKAYQRAEDAFDPFDHDAIEAALSQGVTTIYLPARAPDGIGGLGAVFRLSPDKEGSWVVKERAALDVTIGADPSQGPIARVRTAGAFRQAWIDAKKYRRAQEDYEEALKEYEEKIAERAKKEAEGKKEEGGAESKPDATPQKPAPENKLANPTEPPPRPPRRGRRPPTEEPGGARPQQGGQPQKSEDEIKKPEPPPRDSTKELLLEVLDGKLRVRVEVERPADIENVLEVAEEFNLAVVLVGAAGAGSLAEQIGEHRAAVIQSIAPRSMMFDPGPARFADSSTLASLNASKTPFALASGATYGPDAARHLALGAALVTGQAGLAADAALASITSSAAVVLGIDRECGRVARGLSADLVIWSTHPFDPAARVERVFIAGKEVYNAEKNEEGTP